MIAKKLILSRSVGEREQSSECVKSTRGTVPLSDYLETLSAEEIAKLGLDLFSIDFDNAFVTLAHGTESVTVNEEDTYLLFLSYDKEKDIYFM